MRNQTKLKNIGVGKDHARCIPASTLMGIISWNSFNNILTLKIRVVFEFNSTNSSSADTNLDTFKFFQKWQLRK